MISHSFRKWLNKCTKPWQQSMELAWQQNQLGWKFNLLVIDTRNYEEDGDTYTFVNAEILQSEGGIMMEEGCLSIPDIRAQIKRPETIMLRYQDVAQKNHERHYSVNFTCYIT